MPWVKLDDQFADHPKIVACGPLASWLYVCGLGYCSRLLTDGFIPDGQVRKLADVEDARGLAERLVEVNLWERAEGGYRIHDYHDYQPTREKALATREARAEAGSRGGKQKASNLLDASQADARPVAKQNSTPYPSRTHPVPLPHPDPVETPPIPPAPRRPDPAPPSGGGRKIHPAPRPSTLNAAQQARFDRWYPNYPNKQHRPEAEKAFAKLDPDDAQTDRLVTDTAARQLGRKWADGFIEHPATYLRNRVWEDDIEPVRLTPARASPNGKSRLSVSEHNDLVFREVFGNEPADVPEVIEATFRRH